MAVLFAAFLLGEPLRCRRVMEITTGVSISRRMVIITITSRTLEQAMAFAFGSTLDNYQRKTASSKNYQH